VRAVQEEKDWKKNQYFMMIRVAVTGRQATPPLFATMKVLGKDAVLERLGQALQSLGK
jgi:glutamyl/glutaminyl-tRNA synthetase